MSVQDGNISYEINENKRGSLAKEINHI